MAHALWVLHPYSWLQRKHELLVISQQSLNSVTATEEAHHKLDIVKGACLKEELRVGRIVVARDVSRPHSFLRVYEPEWREPAVAVQILTNFFLFLYDK